MKLNLKAQVSRSDLRLEKSGEENDPPYRMDFARRHQRKVFRLRPEEDDQGLTANSVTLAAGFGSLSGSPFCLDLAARRGSGRLGRFIGAGSLCDHRGGHGGRIGSECKPF